LAAAAALAFAASGCAGVLDAALGYVLGM